MNNQQITIAETEQGFAIRFNAMASPCEVLIQTSDAIAAKSLGYIAAQEVWRIEQKYSRYLTTSYLTHLNQNAGQICDLDEETASLLNFADTCYQLSDGLFDLTSGILGKIWRFDQSDQIPTQADIDRLLPFIGWHKITLGKHHLKMPAGMQLDFGGIGKEYAADKAIALVNQACDSALPILVNLGGDLVVNGPQKNGQAWHVGVEQPGFEQQTAALISIKQGALATSGDAKRYLLKNGIKYSHILNPKNGWPISDSLKSVTVSAPSCIQAGFLSTLALLNGKQAQLFLQQNNIQSWCIA